MRKTNIITIVLMLLLTVNIVLASKYNEDVLDKKTIKYTDKLNSNKYLLMETDKELYRCLSTCTIQVKVDNSLLKGKKDITLSIDTNEKLKTRTNETKLKNVDFDDVNQKTFYYQVDVPVGLSKTKFNVTMSDGTDTFVLDPDISSACNYIVADNIINCTGTISGNTLVNNSHLWIHEATINAGATYITITSNTGWINITGSTFNADTGDSDRSISITALTDLNITSSTLNSFGAGDIRGGSYTLSANNSYITSSTINSYGYTLTSGCGGNGNGGSSTGFMNFTTNSILNKLTINGYGGAGHYPNRLGGSVTIQMYGAKYQINNTIYNGYGGAGGGKDGCTDIGGGDGGSVALTFNIQNITTSNTTFNLYGGGGGSGTLSYAGGTGGSVTLSGIYVSYNILNRTKLYNSSLNMYGGGGGDAGAGVGGSGGSTSGTIYSSLLELNNSILNNNKGTAVCAGSCGTNGTSNIKINFTSPINYLGLFPIYTVNAPLHVFCNDNLLRIGLNSTISSNINNTCSNYQYYGYQEFIDEINRTLSYTSQLLGSITNLLYLNITSPYSIVSNLIYNDVTYSPTSSTSNNLTQLSKSVSAPSSTSDSNITFYFNYTLNGTYYQTPYLTQSVFYPNVDNCTTYSTTALNYTIKDETNNSLIVSSVSNAFNFYWGTMTRAYSNSQSGQSSYKFCIYPSWANFTTDIITEYSATSYDTRSYTQDAFNFDNTTDYINLSLLLSSLSTDITVSIIDAYSVVVPDAIVETYIYNIVTDAYSFVASESTDTNGQVIFSLNTNSRYKFIVKQNGNVVYTSGTFKPIQTEYTFQIGASTIGQSPSEALNSITKNLSYNPTTRVVSLTWEDVTPVANLYYFEVYKHNSTSDTLIYSSNSTSNSGSDSYTIASNNYGYFTANFYARWIEDNSKYVVDSIPISRDDSSYGSETLIFSFFFISILFFLGITISVEIAFILGLISFIAMYWIGFLNAGAGFMGIVILFIIIIMRSYRT